VSAIRLFVGKPSLRDTLVDGDHFRPLECCPGRCIRGSLQAFSGRPKRLAAQLLEVLSMRVNGLGRATVVLDRLLRFTERFEC
jgi:hypothetical protein